MASKIGFVPNSNYTRFLQEREKLRMRGDTSAGFMLVYGDPGTGKTKAVSRFAVDENAFYVRVVNCITKLALMQLLASAMPGVDVRGSAYAIQQRIIAYMAQCGRPLIIDEVQHLIPANGRGVPLLECVRDICDMSGCEIILVAGEIGVDVELKKHEQIARRISAQVEMLPLTVADVEMTLASLAEVRCTPDLAAELHAKSGGKIGLICNAIPALDKFAQANGKNQLCLADVQGMNLVYQWKARTSKNNLRRVA